MKRIDKQKEKQYMILNEWEDEDWETKQSYGELYKKMYGTIENKR